MQVFWHGVTLSSGMQARCDELRRHSNMLAAETLYIALADEQDWDLNSRGLAVRIFNLEHV